MSTASPSDVRVDCALVFMARAGAPMFSSRACALNYPRSVLFGALQGRWNIYRDPLVIDDPFDRIKRAKIFTSEADLRLLNQASSAPELTSGWRT